MTRIPLILCIVTIESKVCGGQRQTLSPTSHENSTRATLSVTLGRPVAPCSTHLDTRLPSTAPCSPLPRISTPSRPFYVNHTRSLAFFVSRHPSALLTCVSTEGFASVSRWPQTNSCGCPSRATESTNRCSRVHQECFMPSLDGLYSPFNYDHIIDILKQQVARRKMCEGHDSCHRGHFFVKLPSS